MPCRSSTNWGVCRSTPALRRASVRVWARGESRAGNARPGGRGAPADSGHVRGGSRGGFSSAQTGPPPMAQATGKRRIRRARPGGHAAPTRLLCARRVGPGRRGPCSRPARRHAGRRRHPASAALSSLRRVLGPFAAARTRVAPARHNRGATERQRGTLSVRALTRRRRTQRPLLPAGVTCAGCAPNAQSGPHARGQPAAARPPDSRAREWDTGGAARGLRRRPRSRVAPARRECGAGRALSFAQSVGRGAPARLPCVRVARG